MLEYYRKRERQFQSEWLPGAPLPERRLIIQSSGLCFTAEGKITLVSDGSGWVCPGGYPENGETLEETLVREIGEEACARVIACQYLGCICTDELPPVKPGSLPRFYQARYWVRIENDAFLPQHEMTQRCDFPPEQFVENLRWNAKQTAALILADALAVEQARRLAPK